MSNKYDVSPTIAEELAKLEADRVQAIAELTGENPNNYISKESAGTMARIDADGKEFIANIQKEAEQTLTELGIPNKVEDAPAMSEIEQSVYDMSIGNLEIKKLTRAVEILIAVVLAASTSLALLVEYFKTHNKVAELREQYANYEELIDFNTGTGEHNYSRREIGQAIASSIIQKASYNQDLDVNRELIYALGTMDLPKYGYSQSEAFRKNGDNPDYLPQGWAEGIYSEIRYELMEAGVIALPETLKQYMIANGFAKGKFRLNDITKKISFVPLEEGEELSVDDIYKNLREFTQAYAVNSEGLDDIQGLGGRK